MPWNAETHTPDQIKLTHPADDANLRTLFQQLNKRVFSGRSSFLTPPWLALCDSVWVLSAVLQKQYWSVNFAFINHKVRAMTPIRPGQPVLLRREIENWYDSFPMPLSVLERLPHLCRQVVTHHLRHFRWDKGKTGWFAPEILKKTLLFNWHFNSWWGWQLYCQMKNIFPQLSLVILRLPRNASSQWGFQDNQWQN